MSSLTPHLTATVNPTASKVRAAFIMEQLLGHITHSKNLQTYLASHREITAEVVETPGPPHRLNQLPPVQRDPMLRIAVDGYLALKRASRTHDVAFIHTQAAALFCGATMRSFPTVVSLDATDLQFRRLYYPNLTVPDDLPLKLRLKVFVMQKTDIKKRLAGQVRQNARHFITWSQWCKDSLVSDYGIGGDKVTVIPPGVDTAYFRPDPMVRKNDGVTRLLFVGGDFTRKGGDLLLQWAKQKAAQPAQSAWELHLVTPTPLSDLPANVYVHNAVKNNSPEIVRLYQQSDVFVLPTRADCTPLVGMESQACGLPVIATSVGGVPEQVDEGVTGFVIAPDNLSELTARLDTFLAHPEVAERMGQAARVRALQHFDLATNYARLVQVVQSVQNTK